MELEELRDKQDEAFEVLAMEGRSEFGDLLEPFNDAEAAELTVLLRNASNDVELLQSVTVEFYRLWSVIRKLVPTQPAFPVNDIVFKCSDGSMTYRDAYLQTKMLRACWSYEAIKDLQAWHGIDPTKELVSILGHEVFTELSREVLTDLRNSATQLPIPQRSHDESPGDFVKRFITVVGETGMYDWMIGPPEVVDLLELEQKQDWFTESIIVNKRGTFADLDIYRDVLYVPNEVLFGSSSNPGYCCGINRLSVSPPVIDPAAFVPRSKFGVSYFKRSLPEAEASYGKMKFEF